MYRRNKSRGFTLVELLATIVIMGIVATIGVIACTSAIKNSKEKLKKVESSQLKKAASAYYTEFKNSPEYVSFKDNGVIYSCISVKALREMGYYQGDFSVPDDEITYDNAVVKVKQVAGKAATYEVIMKYDGDKDCIYNSYTSELGDTDLDVETTGSGVSMNAKIEADSSEKNSYNLQLQLTADVFDKIETVEVDSDVYVSFVVDESGSMKNNDRWTNASAATVNMSKTLNEKFGEHLYLSLIKFGETADFVRRFSDTNHSDSFDDLIRNSSNGSYTFTADGLSAAYQEIRTVTDENVPKYVILLTDGSATSTSCQTNCTCSSLSSCSSYLRDISNLIIIGYDWSADASYKTYATSESSDNVKVCTDGYVSGNSTYCYYESTSDQINKLFDNISKQIVQNVVEQTLSKAKIVAVFDKFVKVYDKDGNAVDNLTVDVEFQKQTSTEKILERIYEYKLSTYISQDEFVCDYENRSCTYETPLFTEYYLELYDLKGNVVDKLLLDNSPMLTIKKELSSYINNGN